MKAKRWTLGVVLAAAVSLVGLIQADASPFSSYILSDDLGNHVNGVAPTQDAWGDGSSTGNHASATAESASGGTENDGHGNNADGVDSSNKGASGDKLGGDQSCLDPANCVDDETRGGGAAPSKK